MNLRWFGKTFCSCYNLQLARILLSEKIYSFTFIIYKSICNLNMVKDNNKQNHKSSLLSTKIHFVGTHITAQHSLIKTVSIQMDS